MMLKFSFLVFPFKFFLAIEKVMLFPKYKHALQYTVYFSLFRKREINPKINILRHLLLILFLVMLQRLTFKI